MTTNHLSIVYPHNQRLMGGKANDILIMRTCHALARNGHNVNLVTGRPFEGGDIYDYYGIKASSRLNIIKVPMLRGKPFSWHFIYNLFCLFKLIELKRSNMADIVYLRELKLARFLLRFKKVIGLPFAIEVHDLKIKKFYEFLPKRNPMEQYVFKNVDGIIVLLNVFGDILKETYDINNIPLVKIPLASDRFPFSYKLSDKKMICYIGQLYPAQGIELMLESLTYLPDASLSIIGGNDRDLHRLKRIAADKGLSDRTLFHGFVKPQHVFERAKDADVMVICAVNKGKRRYSAHAKLYEYMAMGKPIVAFDIPSIREETINMKNVLLAKPDDPKDLATKIAMVLNNKELAEALAFNAYQTAEDYTWEKRANRLADFFKSLIKHEVQA